MPIITLISDWGTQDYYAAAVKGRLLSLFPEVTIVDISHDIVCFDVKMASYVLKNAYQNFPKGTVHIIGIKTTESPLQKHIAFKLNDHYFVGADNGIPTLLLDHDSEPQQIIELNVMHDSYNFNFSERDLFAKVAVHLAKGLPIADLGSPQSSFLNCTKPQAYEEKDKIIGHVEHIDTYGNICTNISEELFKKCTKGKSFAIPLKGLGEIKTISKSYEDTSEYLAIINAAGYLEIALNEQPLGRLADFRIDDSITINIIEK